MKLNLLGSQNAKTIKGEKTQGIKTYILYLAPHTMNSKGINLCSHATEGCKASCLFSSGNAMFPKVVESRIKKSNLFVENRNEFFSLLIADLINIKNKHSRELNKIAIRLNGTSDIPYEKYIIEDNKNIFEMFPEVQFYDYTKNPIRMKKDLPSNYHLTFSYSEKVGDDILNDILSSGKNVAVVFDKKLPNEWMNSKVVDGDVDDVRFNNVGGFRGLIIGLKYKKVVTEGAKNDISENDFVVKL